MALQSSSGPGHFFSSLILYTVGTTPCTGDKPIARLLPRRDNKNRINADRHPCLEWDLKRRPQCLSWRRHFIPPNARPRRSVHLFSTWVKQNTKPRVSEGAHHQMQGIGPSHWGCLNPNLRKKPNFLDPQQTCTENDHLLSRWILDRPILRPWRWRESVWKTWKPFPLPGLELRHLDRPARRQSLHRLRYPGIRTRQWMYVGKFFSNWATGSFSRSYGVQLLVLYVYVMQS
jgi:hypothetical protein